MKKNQKIIFKNSIQKEFLKHKNGKNFEIFFPKINENILLNINNPKYVFNTLNDNFKLSFNSKDLHFFQKFKTYTSAHLAQQIRLPKSTHAGSSAIRGTLFTSPSTRSASVPRSTARVTTRWFAKPSNPHQRLRSLVWV